MKSISKTTRNSNKMIINIPFVHQTKFMSNKTLKSIKINSFISSTENLPIIRINTEPNSLSSKSKKIFLTAKNQKRPHYLNEDTESSKYKIKKEFNKLYGLDETYFKVLKSIKNEKNLTLSQHQNKLLNISSNLSKENLIRLYTEFKNIKAASEVVKPLPPVNFKLIIDHSKEESKKNKNPKNKKNVPLKEILNQKKEKDPFEEEMMNIKLNQTSLLKKENPALLKVFYILPEYLVEALLLKKKKKFD